MALFDQSIRSFTRCVGPTQLGGPLSRWAQQHFTKTWVDSGCQEVVTEHFDRGLWMRVDRTHHIGGAIYWRGFHSRRILRAIDRLVQPHSTLVDVGANQGEVTLYAARRATQGRVVAFEPMREHYRRLVNNVRLNGLDNVACYNHCLGDERGQASMYAAQSDSRKHRHGWNEGLASMFASAADSTTIGRVEVHRLDDVFPILGTARLDILKIDVEGAELHVLRGAQKTIDRFQPSILIEMNAETFHAAGYTVRDVSEFLLQFGYRGFQIDRLGRCRTSDVQQLPTFCDMLWVPTNKTGSFHAFQDLSTVKKAC